MTPGVSMLLGVSTVGSARFYAHLALELLHDVEEAVVDVWLVVELYLRG